MDIYLQHFNGEAIIATFLCEKLKIKQGLELKKK